MLVDRMLEILGAAIRGILTCCAGTHAIGQLRADLSGVEREVCLQRAIVCAPCLFSQTERTLFEDFLDLLFWVQENDQILVLP